MLAEALAAGLVGLLALFVVLRPLIWPPSPAATVYEPVEQEETLRGVALLALKEIEFDRETGKLSDEDYKLLKDKYTAEAIEALRAEEKTAAPRTAAPDDVEALIAHRVRALRSAAASPPPGAPVCPACGPRPEPDALFCSTCGGRLADGAACVHCGTALSADSLFCEGCGSRVAA